MCEDGDGVSMCEDGDGVSMCEDGDVALTPCTVAVFMYPSVFCIGLKGKSLIIMNGEQSPSQMRSKLSDAFQVSLMHMCISCMQVLVQSVVNKKFLSRFRKTAVYRAFSNHSPLYSLCNHQFVKFIFHIVQKLSAEIAGGSPPVTGSASQTTPPLGSGQPEAAAVTPEVDVANHVGGTDESKEEKLQR